MLNPKNTEWVMLLDQGGSITIDAPGAAALAGVSCLLSVRDMTDPVEIGSAQLTVEEVHELIRRLRAWETEYHRARQEGGQ